jgi:hypothetical protein
MIPRILLFSLVLATAAAARSSSGLSAGFRLGARVGPSEFTPEIGVAAFAGRNLPYLTLDGWFQPWRYRVTEENLPYMANDEELIYADIQFRERRWGLTQGVHYDLGNSMFGIVPGAGWEWSWGDWEGDIVDPPFESAPWVGGGVRILPWIHLGTKYYPTGLRAGDWKLEFVAQFGGPKRK